ncbi:hypothetical protein MBLNU457_6511t2 [Dothideomycetes sp. NU457]
MGTLTGDQQRLPEFWENRVAATNLRPTQTRIPEVPNQTDFLERWYEFHRGYRIVQKADGTEERHAVLGEPWKDVSPGQLPRTLEELRAGLDRSAADQQQHIEVEQNTEPAGPSLEETLEQMLGAADAEETAATGPAERTGAQETAVASVGQLSRAPEGTTNIAGQVMQATGSRNREYQARRIASLRRELQRMRHGVERVISGLRELGEAVPDSAEATGRLAILDQSLDNILAIRDTPGEHNRALASRLAADRALGLGHTAVGPPTVAAPGAAAAPRPNDRSLEGIQRRLESGNTALADATEARNRANARLAEVERHLSLARTAHDEAVAYVDVTETDVRHARQQVERLQRERRTVENYTRVFGTREDMEREDYVSPIGGMFNRAWERFRDAEQTRREERTLRQVLDDEGRVRDALRAPGSLEEQNIAADNAFEDELNEYYRMLREQDWTQSQPAIEAAQRNFPQSMLDAIHNLDAEERQARIQYIASMDARRAVTGADAPPEQGDILDRLLRGTPDAEREAIRARMTANGTAQALEGISADDPLTLWRRLQDNPPAVRFTPSDSDSDDGHRGLDVEDDGRPEPKGDEELTMKLDCKVCYTQLADTACLPCGHLVLCQWCSEQHSPVMQHDRTRPRRPANCPLCRKRIKQKVRIFRP